MSTVPSLWSLVLPTPLREAKALHRVLILTKRMMHARRSSVKSTHCLASDLDVATHWYTHSSATASGNSAQVRAARCLGVSGSQMKSEADTSGVALHAPWEAPSFSATNGTAGWCDRGYCSLIADGAGDRSSFGLLFTVRTDRVADFAITRVLKARAVCSKNLPALYARPSTTCLCRDC